MNKILYAAITILSTTLISVSASAAELKNGLIDAKLENIYTLDKEKIKQSYQTKFYYINDKPYTGWVEFGNGEHYFENGKPVPYLFKNETLYLFNRNGKIVEESSEDYQEIQKAIQTYQDADTEKSTLICKTNNIKRLYIITDLLNRYYKNNDLMISSDGEYFYDLYRKNSIK